MNYNIYKLCSTTPPFGENGLRILLIPNKTSYILSCGIDIKIGAIDENKDENGIAHFLEHMSFKGTDKYDIIKLHELLDHMSIRYNASTSIDYTQYEMHGLPKYYKEMIDILLELYFKANIDINEVEKERNVILEEANMYKDNIDTLQSINIMKMTTSKYPEYNNNIIGTTKSIKNITHKQLIEFRKKYFDYKKTMIVIYGNFELNKMIKLLTTKLSYYLNDNIELKTDTTTLNKYSNDKIEHIDDIYKPLLSQRYKYKHKNIINTHIYITFATYKAYHSNIIICNLICLLLINGMTGRLTQKLRVDNQLTYNVDANIMPNDKFGLFLISSIITYNNLEKTINIILEELSNLYKNGINENELTKIKQDYIISKSIYFQNQMNFFYYYKDKLKHNYDVQSLTEIIDNVNKITMNDINKIIKEIVDPTQLFISIVGPTKPNKNIILNSFKLFANNIK